MRDPQSFRLNGLLLEISPELSRLQPWRAPRSLPDRMRELNTPGLALAIIEDFEVIVEQGFGFGRQGDPASVVSGKTLFQAASISKPVFALAVMRLVNDGVLNLDEDVNNYLKSWRIPANKGWTPRVTLRQLLSHSSGATVHGFMGYPRSHPVPSVEMVLDGVGLANNLPVIISMLPGLTPRYSGGGSVIAQKVVTDVLQADLPGIMRKLIFGPLGMEQSSYEQPLSEQRAGEAAVAHPWNGVPLEGGGNVYPELAAAGLWTSVSDLARLGVELMRTLRGQESSLGLDRESISKMLEPQVPGQQNAAEYYGLGWRCTGKGEGFQFWHGGRNEGFTSLIKLLPNVGKGAVVMFNSTQGEPLRGEVVAAVAHHYGWPAYEEGHAVSQSFPPNHYEGTYVSVEGCEFEIRGFADGLRLSYGNQEPISLKLTSANSFQAEEVELTIDFEMAEDTSIKSFTILQGEGAIKARKI